MKVEGLGLPRIHEISKRLTDFCQQQSASMCLHVASA